MIAPDPPRPPRVLLGVLLVVLGVLLAGCGVPADESPREFSLSGELQSPAESSPSTVLDAPSAVIFLVQTDDASSSRSLVPQGIDVPPASGAAYIRAVLEQLIATTPASDQETIANFTSQLTLQDVEVDRDIVRLTFSDLGDLTGEGLTYGIAQIVYTATAMDGPGGVEGVVFLEEKDGQVSEVQVNLEGGETSRAGDPVMRSDFPLLFNQLTIPLSSTSTTVADPATTTSTTAG
jgi:hypothetical protein